MVDAFMAGAQNQGELGSAVNEALIAEVAHSGNTFILYSGISESSRKCEFPSGYFRSPVAVSAEKSHSG